MSVLFSFGSCLMLAILLFGITPFLRAESNEAPDEVTFTRRIVWRGGENALRYAVEIERAEGVTYSGHLSEFTTSHSIEVTLPPGEYRFRIIPYDILGRPSEGTQWFHFTIRYTPKPLVEDSGQPEVINVEDYEDKEQRAESGELVAESAGRVRGSPRFNTVGVSAGTSFIDPLIIVSVHGTYSPINKPLWRNLFVELGCDIGFVSIYDDVESYFSVYPFAHIGYFFPFKNKGGLFAGGGGGYMFGKHSFAKGDVKTSVWAVNFTGGVNLFDFLNISYTLRTDFGSIGHKLSAGYVYRFREK